MPFPSFKSLAQETANSACVCVDLELVSSSHIEEYDEFSSKPSVGLTSFVSTITTTLFPFKFPLEVLF